MKPLRVTAILSLFAAGAETVLLDRRYATQDVWQELLNANKVATLSAVRPHRAIHSLQSVHVRSMGLKPQLILRKVGRIFKELGAPR